MICLVSRENAYFQPDWTKHNYVNDVKKFFDSDLTENEENMAYFSLFSNHFVIFKQKKNNWKQNGLGVPNWKSIFCLRNLHESNFEAQGNATPMDLFQYLIRIFWSQVEGYLLWTVILKVFHKNMLFSSRLWSEAKDKPQPYA